MKEELLKRELHRMSDTEIAGAVNGLLSYLVPSRRDKVLNSILHRRHAQVTDKTDREKLWGLVEKWSDLLGKVGRLLF